MEFFFFFLGFVDETDKIFERVATVKDLRPLKSSLLLFLRHYVRGFKLGLGNGGSKTPLSADDKVGNLPLPF